MEYKYVDFRRNSKLRKESLHQTLFVRKPLASKNYETIAHAYDQILLSLSNSL